MKRHSSNLKSIKGFTLMELVAVIAVLTILMGILMPNLITQKQHMDRFDREKTAEVATRAAAQYYAFEGAYPQIWEDAAVEKNIDAELSEKLYNELREVTNTLLPLEPGYYMYNRVTGAIALIPD